MSLEYILTYSAFKKVATGSNTNIMFQLIRSINNIF